MAEYKPMWYKSPFGHVCYTLVRNKKQYKQAIPKKEYRSKFMCGERAVAMCYTFIDENNQVCCVVQLPYGVTWPKNNIIATLVHEGTHVWQEVRDLMSCDEKPSREFEAYSIQQITEGLLALYDLSENKT